ncbi:MAG TPA: hypothetical protein HPP83_00520 [Candidatus Hydrogenedentes bacterium]|nr:hypothetical protein [Candidatus Hydrogenedentota bacterium]
MMNLIRLGLGVTVVVVAMHAARGAEGNDDIAITFPEAHGRRVFRNTERPVVEVSLPVDAARRLRGRLCGDEDVGGDLEFADEADGKVRAELPLSGLAPGKYVVRVFNETAEVEVALHIVERPSGTGFFPVVCQFSPVPSGEGWRGEEGPLSPEILRATVDNIIGHGFTGIEWHVPLPAGQADIVRNYAQAKGMAITHHAGGLELFGRNAPPAVSVYSDEYARTVRENAQKQLAGLKDIPRLYNVFTYQDEPFTGGPGSFGYTEYDKAEFKKRYGYELPPDLAAAKDDPQVWLDVLDFRTAKFPDGWRQVYRIIKDIDPSFKVVLTHDSHNTFGAGYGSHAQIAIDDVFHWGADFTDMFVYDIYPYWNLDFRFGEPARLMKPRMAMMHYSFAQMRNLAYAHGKELGFWVGTFNPAWFSHFMDDGNRALYWGEREVATTAVAHGADFLLTGYKLPIDAKHWESLGEGLRLIQKAGSYLRTTKKLQAKAAMLFPRTQYLQLQEEYFNVGLSFELFLRAFGELDVLHEEQVTNDSLNGYEALVLFDVKLLPEDVARHIVRFVEKGGLLIADCVPSLGRLKQPMDTMEKLFGVTDAATCRVRREGHYVPCTVGAEPGWHFGDQDSPDESVFTTAALRASVLDVALDLTLVSPRTCAVTSAEVLARTDSGVPAVLARRVGKGQVYLLGFCVQDTYFHAFQEKRPDARAQLRALLQKLCEAAGVRAHVHSSNADIEAAIRACGERAVLFVINHETSEAATNIRVAGLPFEARRVVDLDDGRPVPVAVDDGLHLHVEAPLGTTRLFELLP